MWCARTLYGHAEKVLSVAVLEAFVVKGAWFGGVVLGLAVFVFVLILHFYWVQFGVRQDHTVFANEKAKSHGVIKVSISETGGLRKAGLFRRMRRLQKT